jgi:hypothetical protein
MGATIRRRTGATDKVCQASRSGVLSDVEGRGARMMRKNGSIDDLRKRAILTEAEFDAQKKKLLCSP